MVPVSEHFVAPNGEVTEKLNEPEPDPPEAVSVTVCPYVALDADVMANVAWFALSTLNDADVTDVSPDAVNVSVNAPGVPVTARPVNVPTPLPFVSTELPAREPDPEAIDAEIDVPALETEFPPESTRRTTGWVVSVAAYTPPLGWVVIASAAAGPVVTVIGCDAWASSPDVNVSV